ncbi:MAG TPA: SLC13 family permease, partial [Archangium sp.]|nr:SLC13 family permease [Archangium sp.]
MASRSTRSAPPTSPSRVRLLAGPLAATALLLIPSGLHAVPGMGHRPAAAAAVAAWMALWWFTEAVPMAWTALLPLVLFPALGVFDTGSLPASVGRAALPYVDPYIFLFLGGMALDAALEQWHLHRRIALLIMRAIGTAPQRLLLGMLVATASVSLWISNTATAVMMVPIGMALIAQLEAGEGRRLEHFGAALMLGVAYAANVGGIGTKHVFSSEQTPSPLSGPLALPFRSLLRMPLQALQVPHWAPLPVARLAFARSPASVIPSASQGSPRGGVGGQE